MTKTAFRRRLVPVLLAVLACAAPLAALSTAEDVLRRADERLAAAPGDYAATQNRGWALYELGRFVEAAQAFERACGLARDDAGRAAARYNLGNALFRQQKVREALEQYRQGLRLAPTDEDLVYNFTVAKRLQSGQQDDKNKKDNKDNKDGKGKPDPKDGRQGQPNQGPAKPGTLSREEALRLLGQLEEQARRNQPQGQPKLRQLKKEKDW